MTIWRTVAASIRIAVLAGACPAFFPMGPFRSACLADDVIDSPMYRDPNVPNAHAVMTFPKGLTRLWIEALGRPEVEYKTQAALTIALAHGQGMKGLEAAIPALRHELERPEIDSNVALATAKALAALDAREAAPLLLKVESLDLVGLAEIIDPALARWDYKPARLEWIERIGRSPAARGMRSAIESLGAVGEEKAAPRLRELVFSRDASASIRLESASALGAIRTSGSEADAQSLSADASPKGMTDRLLAVSLLRRHRGAEALKLLSALAADREPAIAAVALTRLIEIDAGLVEPILASALANDDANVRSRGVEALFQTPTAAHLQQLGDRLSDPHPSVRVQARQSMRALAAKLRDPVCEIALRVLRADDWRGQEQAALLLAQLGRQSATNRLVELLDSRRGEVCLASAWALRKLDVPETLPEVFRYFRKTIDAGANDPRRLPPNFADQHLCQLAQWMGIRLHQPAEPVFRRLVTMKSAGAETRTAAIWALARFHPGDPAPDIVRSMIGRLNAVGPGDMEPAMLRRMCAVSLGLMNAKEAVPSLRQYNASVRLSLDIVNNGCGWALEKITGERMPPGDVVEQMQRNWFLSPID